jgi:hypothetical protein
MLSKGTGFGLCGHKNKFSCDVSIAIFSIYVVGFSISIPFFFRQDMVTGLRKISGLSYQAGQEKEKEALRQKQIRIS